MLDWMNNSLLKNMDTIKLELINTAVHQTTEKSRNSLTPVLMSLITSANRKGILFSSDEIMMILNILKAGKFSQEKLQIDQTVKWCLAL